MILHLITLVNNIFVGFIKTVISDLFFVYDYEYINLKLTLMPSIEKWPIKQTGFKIQMF